MVWSSVTKKPVVHDSVEGADTLIANMFVCGVWEPQTEALFDIRVWMTLADACSYHVGTPQDVLHTVKGEKCKYIPAGLKLVRVALPHLLFSVHVFLWMAYSALKQNFLLRDFLPVKWERLYGVVTEWVRACLSFAILRAALLHLRGSRIKWRRLGIVNGASLPIITVSPFVLFVCLSVVFYGVTQSLFFKNNTRGFIYDIVNMG